MDYGIEKSTIKTVLYTFIMFAYHTFDIIPHTMLPIIIVVKTPCKLLYVIQVKVDKQFLTS